MKDKEIEYLKAQVTDRRTDAIKLREKEKLFERMREENKDNKFYLERKVEELQKELESSNSHYKKSKDDIKHKNEAIRNFEETVTNLKTELRKNDDLYTRDINAFDLESETLKQESMRLREE